MRLSAEVGGAPRVLASAHHLISTSHWRTVAAPGAPAGKTRAKKKKCTEGTLRRGKAAGEKVGPAEGAHHGLKGDHSGMLCQRQQGNHRWARVEDEFVGKVCLTLSLGKRERRGRTWFRTRGVSLSLLSCSLNLRFDRSYHRRRAQEMSPKAKAELMSVEAREDCNPIDPRAAAFTFPLIWHKDLLWNLSRTRVL